MKFQGGRLAAVAVLAAGAMLATAVPASSATYVWMDKTIAPDGTVYTETAQAGNFSRTGITGQIPKADGYTWSTTVWFNGYSSSGDSMATQNGPRGWGKTKAKFQYRLYAKGDTARVKAWLLDAKMNGTSRTSSVGLLDDDPTDVPPVASITASDLRANNAGDFELTSYGVTDGGELWTGRNGEFDCVFVAQGEYVASSCTPVGVAEKYGVSLHAQSADQAQSIQVAFSPKGGITSAIAEGAGLEQLSSNVAVNTDTPVVGELRVPANTSLSRSAGAAPEGVTIRLLVTEE